VNGSKLCKLLRTEPVKERAGWNTVQEIFKKTKKSHTKERGPTTPYIVENRKKEATRRERSQKKHEKGENDIKQEQVKKGLRTSLHESA